MTAITLELPDDLAARLSALPDHERNAYAAERLASGLDEPDADDMTDAQVADAVAGIRRGLEDVQAGRLLTLEQARERIEVGLAARFK